MASFKCKVCSGTLTIENDGNGSAICDYCGTHQIIPAIRDNRVVDLFSRANKLRMDREYVYATSIYESIVAEYPKEAEAYWGICLCKYGVEYLDSYGISYNKIFCHIIRDNSIFEDADYQNAILFSGSVQKEMYKNEAEQINNFQNTIKISNDNSLNTDIYVCCFENDTNLRIVEEIYRELSQKGYIVYREIVRDYDDINSDKLVLSFQALKTSKTIIIVSDNAETFSNSIIRSKWEYFQKKKIEISNIICCINKSNIIELPNALKGIASVLDISQNGYIQDLLYGLSKLNNNVSVETDTETEHLTNLMLESTEKCISDSNWKKAKEFINKLKEEGVLSHRVLLCDFCVRHNFNGRNYSVLPSEEDLQNDDVYKTLWKYVEINKNAIKGINYIHYCIGRKLYDYYLKHRTAYDILDSVLKNVTRSDEDYAKEQVDIIIKNSVADIKNFIEQRTEDSVNKALNIIGVISKYGDFDIYKQKCEDLLLDIQLELHIKELEDYHTDTMDLFNTSKTISDYTIVRECFYNNAEYEPSNNMISICDAIINKMNIKRKRRINFVTIASLLYLVIAIICIVHCSSIIVNNTVLDYNERVLELPMIIYALLSPEISYIYYKILSLYAVNIKTLKIAKVLNIMIIVIGFILYLFLIAPSIILHIILFLIINGIWKSVVMKIVNTFRTNKVCWK